MGKRELVLPWTPPSPLEATSAFAAAVPRSPGRLLRTPEPGQTTPRSKAATPKNLDHFLARDHPQLGGGYHHARYDAASSSASSAAFVRSSANTPRSSPYAASAKHGMFSTLKLGNGYASGRASSAGNTDAADLLMASESPALSERPLRVSDLDQSEQTESWIKKPLYYTHHRKPKHEQLSQVIHLPPMQRNWRFKASEGASWDCIAENAFQAMQLRPETHMHVIVLLYCVPCNPFHLGDVDVLKRARASLEALPDVAVIGALVVPTGEATMRENGVLEDRRLPYALRRDLARCVLKAAEQTSWVIVDTCLEGCMKNVPGSIAPFLSVYARGRLHGRGYETRIVEVKAEDPITGSGSRGARPFDHFHVSPVTFRGGVGQSTSEELSKHAVQKVTLDAVGTLIVDVPKQTQCDDLIWSAVKSPQEKQHYATLERFCGTGGARLIMDWANSKGLTRGKTKLLAD